MAHDPSPARVGYVLRKFPVLSETFVLSEMLALEERGIPIHVFSLQRPNDPRFHEDLPRLKARVTYVPEIPQLRKVLGHHRRLARAVGGRYREAFLYALRARKPGIAWRFLQSGYVASEARRLKLGHLHAQFANSPATVACLASRLTGIPYSFTAHAMDIFKSRVDPRGLVRKVGDARFVITVSEYNKRFLQELTEAPPGRIHRIYNGIDLDRFSPNGDLPRDPFRILCVARLVEKKGLPDLIDACGRLRDAGLRFRCDIVGKGRLRPALRDRIKALRLTREVRLAGPRTQIEVRDLYREAHLYVLPCVVGRDGNREGLPVSIVEALASGLPVVSTPITGIPEVIRDGENGFLVPPGDPGKLAETMARLIRDPGLYDRLRSGARPSVLTRFDHRRTSEQIKALLGVS